MIIYLHITLLFQFSFAQNLTVSCENGGTLLSDGSCRCETRYDGPQCQNEPCLNGGKKSSDSMCHCPFGWSGESCDTATVCLNGYLQNGTCFCNPRWTGGLCNIRLCRNGNHGTEEGTCLCDLGFTGFFCELSINCNYGNLTESNQCDCHSGFIPPKCIECFNGFQFVEGECVQIKQNITTTLPTTSNQKYQVAETSISPWWYGLLAAFLGLPATGIGGVVAWRHYTLKKLRVGSSAGPLTPETNNDNV